MNYGDYKYFWQVPHWPHIRYDLDVFTFPSRKSAGHWAATGPARGHWGRITKPASIALLTDNVNKTSEIEDEHLNFASVRSSIVRRLSVDVD